MATSEFEIYNYMCSFPFFVGHSPRSGLMMVGLVCPPMTLPWPGRQRKLQLSLGEPLEHAHLLVGRQVPFSTLDSTLAPPWCLL